MKKSRILKLFLGTVVFMGLIAVGLSYYSYKSYHRSWDKSTVIDLNTQKPDSNFFIYSLGCDSSIEECSGSRIDWKRDTTKVEVYLSKEAFIENVEDNIIRYTKKSYIYNKSDIEDVVKTLELNTNNEITDLTFEGYEFASYVVENEIKDTVIEMIMSGDAFVQDYSTKEVYKDVTYRDKGMLCGPLCGSGSKWFEFTDKKIVVLSNFIS